MRLLPVSDSMTKKNDNVFGGRPLLCKESLEQFLTELKKCGAELVFFFDGSWSDQVNIEREAIEINKKYKMRQGLLRLIKSKEKGSNRLDNIQDENKSGINFAYNRNLISVVKGVCEKFGKVSICEMYECDREIVSFTIANPFVLGIFSDDSDYFIFPRNLRYFSTSSIVFNNETLTIKEYQRQKLRTELQLNDLQLIMFATLCGNDWMSFDVISSFHRKIRNAGNALKGTDGFIKDVARIVKEYFQHVTIDLDDLWMIFAQLLSDIAGKDYSLHRMLNEKRETLRKDFKTSLTFYLFNENLQLSLHAAPDVLKDHLTYKILNGKVKTIIPKFHDMDDDSMGKFEDLFHSRLRRQYGTVLKLNSVERELLFFSHNSKERGAKMVKLDPEFPPFEIQKLDDNEPNEEDEKERFKLLKWLSHMEDVENFDMDTFPDEYLTDILTMSCMFMNNAVKLKELDLMLWTIFAFHEKIIPRDSTINGDEYINVRAFRIPHTFAEIHQEILCSIDICKLRKRFSVI